MCFVFVLSDRDWGVCCNVYIVLFISVVTSVLDIEVPYHISYTYLLIHK